MNPKTKKFFVIFKFIYGMIAIMKKTAEKSNAAFICGG